MNDILGNLGINVVGNTRFSFSDDNYVSILSTYDGKDAELRLKQANEVINKHKEFRLKSYAPLIFPGKVSLLIDGTYANRLEADKLVVDIAAVFS